MLRTDLCDRLGIDLPILAAPMGPDLTGPDLVAAVSGAGGLGILQAQLHPPDALREQIRRVRSLTDRPFGVNFILHFPHEAGVAVCLEERVPVLHTFWGDPAPLVERVHAAGVTLLHQTGTVRGARAAVEAGVDAIVAQGVEAGGHVEGEVSTLVLVPCVVDAVAPVPVIAAGGIADGRGIVAALALGAQAVAMGTRFLATREAEAHERYKARLLEAGEEDTLRTVLFDREWPDAPVRTLRTPFVERWLGREGERRDERLSDLIGETVIGGQRVPIHRFTGIPPSGRATGEIDAMDFAMGQGVGLVRDVPGAGDLVRMLAAQAEGLVTAWAPGAPAPRSRC